MRLFQGESGRSLVVFMLVALLCMSGLLLLLPGGGFAVNPAPTVTSITPNKGTNDLPVEITDLKGTDFMNGAIVRLRKGGQKDIIGTSVDVVSSTRITCYLEKVWHAAVGDWDVYVENNDGQNGTLAGGFTVEYPPPVVTFIGPNSATNGGTVSMTTVKGAGFRSGATVQLIGPSGAGDSGGGTINATNVNAASSSRMTCDFNLTGAATGSYTFKVTNDDGKSGELVDSFTVNEADAPTTWYLAEGSTKWGYNCYITIQNPNNEPVQATVTYMTDSGAVPGGDLDLFPLSQVTISPGDTLGDRDFSTYVESKHGKAIAVDRTMSWTGPGARFPEGHCSVGVTSPARVWYLAEGSSDHGFECWLLIQNPNDSEATAHVTYMIEGAEPQVFEKKIPAGSRNSYNMANDIGAKDASIKVDSDIPVIPERSMYRNNRREGHDSIGTTSPAQNYYLAEGTTNYGFTTYVLVQNPNPTPIDVTVTYMTSSGPVPQAPFSMPAVSRKTICVNDVMPGTDFSTQVTGSAPVIAERAMYWNYGPGEACHDSIGISEPHTTFYLPDGQTNEGRETYTLVQNPNDSEVTVEICYLKPGGTDNVIFEETIPANSRVTYDMADKGINDRAAIMVTSKTSGKKIIVERAMYWSYRAAGTDTIGGSADPYYVK